MIADGVQSIWLNPDAAFQDLEQTDQAKAERGLRKEDLNFAHQCLSFPNYIAPQAAMSVDL